MVSVKSRDAIAGVWNATADHLVQVAVAHGTLKATATYPVTDYNADLDNATRFHVTQGGQVVVDKLIDNMPMDLRIITAEDGRTLVLLDTYSGGAHCCYGTALTDPNDASGPSFTYHDWGDVGYNLVKSADQSGYVFESADAAAAYAFSSFAGSTFPIQILSYREGKLVDVTNEYPATLEKDAAQHWREYLTDASSNATPESALVSYLADEYRLGRSKTAWDRVHAAYGSNQDFDTKAVSWLQSNGYGSTAVAPAATPSAGSGANSNAPSSPAPPSTVTKP
ncbi:MAG TPA: hypothetical protein VIJ12_00460 [Candidatus Baltobacteraceae bacterium]